MSLHPSVCADAAVAASQNVQILEFFFDGSTNGAAGVILPLIAAQAVASARVHLAIGGSATKGSAQPSLAAVEALIKRPNGNSLSATEENIKTGVKALLDDVAVAADGAACIAFALGGLNARDVVAAELMFTSNGADAFAKDTLSLAQTSAVVRIPEPVALVSGRLKRSATDVTGATLGTDKLVAVGGELNGSCSTVVGVFVLPELTTLPVAGSTLRLRLTVRN